MTTMINLLLGCLSALKNKINQRTKKRRGSESYRAVSIQVNQLQSLSVSFDGNREWFDVDCAFFFITYPLESMEKDKIG